MSAVKTYTQWSVLGAEWIDTDPASDVSTISLSSDGKEYVVACSGPKGMKAAEIISAIRAAAAHMLRVVGADMSVVGAQTPDTAKFDTGDQRAN